MSYPRLAVGCLFSLLFVAGHSYAQTTDVATLAGKLSDRKKATRLSALKQLGKLGTAAKTAVPDIVQLVRNTDDREELSQGAFTLALIGPAGAPKLAKMLKDGRDEHSRQAAMALAKMGPAAARVQPQLAAALKDRDPIVRKFAAQALGEQKDLSEDTITALFGMVADPNLEARQQAGIALLRAGKKAVPGLLTIYRESKGLMRVEAAGLLGRIGPDAKEALSDLTAGLRSTEPFERASSAHALAGLKSKDALPSLLEGMAKETNFQVQQNIFLALTTLGEQDVPGFLDEMRRINAEGNWAAPFILAKFGPRGIDAVRPLIKTLKDPEPGMRLGAALALGQIGPDAMEAIPHLQHMLKDPQLPVRGAAAQAILQIDRRNEVFAQQQLSFAFQQGHANLAKLKMELAQGKVPLRKVWSVKDRASFRDPVIQMPLRHLVSQNLFFTSISFRVPVPLTKEGKNQLRRILEETETVLEAQGPECIPAYIYAVNLSATYQLGFC